MADQIKQTEGKILVCEENKTLADGLAKMVSEVFYIPVRALNKNGDLVDGLPEYNIHYSGIVVKQEDVWSTIEVEKPDYALIGGLDGMFGEDSRNLSEFIRYRSVNIIIFCYFIFNYI